MRLFPRFLLIVLLLLAGSVQAQLSVEITGAGGARIPVSIADFAGDSASARALVSVVRADLERSGMFRMVDAGVPGLNENSPINYGTFKSAGADAVAAGSLTTGSDGRQEARFRLYDVNRQQELGGAVYVTSSAQLRLAGHRIADYIYEKLTGDKGIFSTRIAYVLKSGGRYQLQVADADGQNAQAALVSNEPIISPAWSPDGQRIAYVSFESKKPIVYVHQLATGRRTVVANFKGSNSAPSWSPDGRRLAVVLTKDGGSQIYLINADGSGVRHLVTSYGIDTEPAWSADGQYLYFTSDRGGSPQIYRASAGGGDIQRITFDGNYNVTPRPSPDGRLLAFIARREGRFQLSVMDLASRQVQILTDSYKDESPSFAPNSRMIVIATQMGGRGVLSAVSADGRTKQRLSVAGGDVREPAWGPFQR
jgi:TolB protein